MSTTAAERAGASAPAASLALRQTPQTMTGKRLVVVLILVALVGIVVPLREQV